MAQLTIHGNWKSIAAAASAFVMLGLIAYAVVATESIGIWLYVAAFATIVFGFWSKEDHFAITGIAGISAIVILDIVLRIGVLGFTECKPIFSIWTGC